MCGRYSNQFYYNSSITCSYDQLYWISFLFFSGRNSGRESNRYSRRSLLLHCRPHNRSGNRSDHTWNKYSRNLYRYLYNGCCRRMSGSDSNYIGNDHCTTCSNNQLYRISFLFFSGRNSASDSNRYSRRSLFLYCRPHNRSGNRSDHTWNKHSRNLYRYLYNGCCRRMSRSDSNHIGNDHYTTCSYDQLYRISFLFFSGRNSGRDSNRYSRRSLLLYCRPHNRSGNRSDHTWNKYSRNLYRYLYNGCRRRMSGSGSNHTGNDHCTTCSNNQLYRISFLFFTGRNSGRDSNRYSRRSLLLYCRPHNRSGNRSHHTWNKYSRNLYHYLYNGCCRRMPRSDSNHIGNNNDTFGSYI